MGFETEADHLQVIQTCMKNKGEVKNKKDKPNLSRLMTESFPVRGRDTKSLRKNLDLDPRTGAGLRSFFKCCKWNSEIPHWTFSGLKICLSWSYYEKWLHIDAVWLLLKMHTQCKCQKDIFIIFFYFSGPLLCKPQHMCNFPLWAAPTGLTMRSHAQITFQGSVKVATNI